MPLDPRRRVVSVGPMPPEKCAYALARYSRSGDSIRQSLEWVRTHDSQRFLEHYYFQYGHASIADLGHLVLCFEGISELAAIEVEDEPLWDGQAKSSRYQDFSQTGFITPPEFSREHAARYGAAAQRLLAAYQELHGRALAHLRQQLPRPAEMKPETYERNLAARAFDVARYLLFLGVATNVGQITSIRTLEKQIRRLKASEYAEVRQVGEEMTQACTEPPDCVWDGGPALEPLAPTLARHVEADCYLSRTRSELRMWAEQNLPPPASLSIEDVDLLRPADTPADIVATLLYPVTDRPFRELYEIARSWSAPQRAEVLDLAVRSRGRRDELLRSFRGNLYAFDVVTDIGAYRDLHRHRRCQQFRQAFSAHLGFETPPLVREAGMEEWYESVMREALEVMQALPSPGSHYLAPFGARMRFLMKMDFAEAEYIARLRSGVKGHFSYRHIAWRMKQKMEEVEPELGRLIEATPPWLEDPLKR
jgi:thymidylate synthase ThyX